MSDLLDHFLATIRERSDIHVTHLYAQTLLRGQQHLAVALTVLRTRVNGFLAAIESQDLRELDPSIKARFSITPNTPNDLFVNKEVWVEVAEFLISESQGFYRASLPNVDEGVEHVRDELYPFRLVDDTLASEVEQATLCMTDYISLAVTTTFKMQSRWFPSVLNKVETGAKRGCQIGMVAAGALAAFGLCVIAPIVATPIILGGGIFGGTATALTSSGERIAAKAGRKARALVYSLGTRCGWRTQKLFNKVFQA